MDFQLSEEQKMIQGEARRVAREVFKDKAARWDKNAEVPWENIQLLGEKGYLGIVIPESHGGSGGTLMDLVLVLEELAWGCVSSTMYVFGSNTHGNRLMHLGSEEQKRKYVPAIARGEIIPAHAMSEPQAGSDAHRLLTTAVRDGDHYVVNGTKCWTSRGKVARIFLVNVRFGAGPDAEKGLLLIDRDTPGFEIGKVEPMMGHRGSPSTELIFRDCRVPASQRMSEGDFGSSILSMSFSRCCNAAIGIGNAQRAFDEACAYIQEREAFGKHLADFQGLRWMIADMKVKLDAARLLIYRAAANASNGMPSDLDAAVAKTFANEAALQVISDAMQLFGANGYSQEYPIERIFRDARGFAIAGGTTQIQRNLIARKVLGKRRY
jgi:alkylation response protein AidB-like acyl-CoA dehydrogenase